MRKRRNGYGANGIINIESVVAASMAKISKIAAKKIFGGVISKWWRSA
jgi:hypothetical protein